MMLRLFFDERGATVTPEWLILILLGGSLGYVVLKGVGPSVRKAHNTVVNRVTNVCGSGF